MDEKRNLKRVEADLLKRKFELEQKLTEMSKEQFSDGQVQDPGDQALRWTAGFQRRAADTCVSSRTGSFGGPFGSGRTRDDLMKERNDMLSLILKDIEKVVAEYSKANGYEFILSSRGLLYGGLEYDLTNEVITRLNK